MGSMGQAFQQEIQVTEWLQAIGLCRLNDRVEHCISSGTIWGIGKQPVFSSNCKGPYRTLRPVIGQLQSPIQKNMHQPALLVYGIHQRRAKHAFWHGIFLLFLFCPAEEGFRYRSGVFQPGMISLLERKSLFCIVFLHAEKPVAIQKPCLGWGAFPDILRNRFQRIRKFPPHMRPTSNNYNFGRQLTVICLIAVCVQQP